MKENLEAIYIMWWRIMVRLWRAKGRLAATLVQPVFFLIAFGLGLRGRGALEFVLPGIVSMGVFMSSTMAGVSVVWDREFGFLKEVLVAPVSRLTIVIGRASGAATTALIQAVWLLVLGMLMGANVSCAGILPALALLTLLSLTAVSFGVSVASVVEDMESFQAIMNLVVFPIIFMSTAFVNPALAPGWLARLVSFNPISYAIDGARFYLSGIRSYSLFADWVVSALVCALFLAISVKSVKRMEA